MDTPLVEHGIPYEHFRKGYRYPFREMGVGDSFLTENTKASRSRLSSAASAFGKRNNVTFSIRKVPEGLRVWRIA